MTTLGPGDTPILTGVSSSYGALHDAVEELCRNNHVMRRRLHPLLSSRRAAVWRVERGILERAQLQILLDLRPADSFAERVPENPETMRTGRASPGHSLPGCRDRGGEVEAEERPKCVPKAFWTAFREMLDAIVRGANGLKSPIDRNAPPFNLRALIDVLELRMSPDGRPAMRSSFEKYVRASAKASGYSFENHRGRPRDRDVHVQKEFLERCLTADAAPERGICWSHPAQQK